MKVILINIKWCRFTQFRTEDLVIEYHCKVCPSKDINKEICTKRSSLIQATD